RKNILTMTNALLLILSLFAGLGAGTLFFEGLWRTVSKAVVNARPVRLFALSFLVRTMLLLLVLWLVSRGDLFRLAVCMAGFLLSRTVILRIHHGGKQGAN